MAAKKTTINFNAMRAALVMAHNSCNTKAITEDQAMGAGVDSLAFKKWKDDVNALRATVFNYVAKKKNARRDAIKDEEIRAARELIFPKWKQVLGAGEKSATIKEIRVSDNDVEDLVGFAWCFMSTANGTAEAAVGEGIFRRLVESLVGCAIVKNSVLTDEDRDALNSYYGAQKTVQSMIDKQAELKTQKKGLTLKLGEVKGKEEKFEAYLNSLIKQLDEQIAEAAAKQAKAETDVSNYAAAAQAVEDKMSLAK